MDDATIKQFQSELKQLLQKYDVMVGMKCDSCSDTYGITGERIVFETNDREEIEVASVYGWWMDASDLD